MENPDARAWDDFVGARCGHILQSAAWGELKSRFGWNALRLALMSDNTIIAGAQILFRRFPLGLRFAYIPRGPVVDPNNPNALAVLVKILCDVAKARGAFALKIEPNWFDDAALDLRALCDPGPKTYNMKLATSIQPRTTIHLDLTCDLDAILAQMKPKWRYNIRLAERKGVVVRASTADDVATFCRLLQITSERDAFAIHSFDYYHAVYELLTAYDYMRLFIAEYKGEPLAAIFVTAFGGEAIYLYGASSNAHRERMPNHALHWAAIKWAKTRGCVRYDLWGGADVADVADALVETTHPEKTLGEQNGSKSKSAVTLPYGLYRFKQGFGGELVQYVGACDAVFSWWRYTLFTHARTLKRGLLG